MPRLVLVREAGCTGGECEALGGCFGQAGDLPSKPAVWRMYLLQQEIALDLRTRQLAHTATNLERSDMTGEVKNNGGGSGGEG